MNGYIYIYIMYSCVYFLKGTFLPRCSIKARNTLINYLRNRCKKLIDFSINWILFSAKFYREYKLIIRERMFIYKNIFYRNYFYICNNLIKT